MNTLWPIPIAAYLVGSIPFGYLIVRMGSGSDVRGAGSGNIGATNVTRVAGKAAGLATLALDAGKGYLAVWMAMRWSHGNIRWMMAAGVAVVLGHTFSCWLGFRGGKGVATGLGVFLAIAWQAVLATLLVWLVVVAFWRYISLGSIVAAAALPILVYLFYAPGHAPPLAVSFGSVAVAIIVIFKHRENIARLIAGTESRLRRRS
ncbi:MAG TPA: glycerol-3-phosphate 1-O-acyltransferase PlsY [Candidatus Acidoferrales bacterium]|nr:glycerol-3-phosphate 1-O-acyltransferase PlsY [Candidatus Acidoferrales bacterium]